MDFFHLQRWWSDTFVHRLEEMMVFLLLAAYVYIQSYMVCSSTNIISMESAVIECFGPLIHEHSHSGWAHSGDQSLCVGWCFQLFSSRLSHNQLDARSAAWLSFPNPLMPTSTGNSHPRCLQRSTSSVYFAFFLS